MSLAMMDEMEATRDTVLDSDVAVFEQVNLQLSWVIHRRLEQDLAAFNLTAPQFMALRCIEDSQSGCTMSELAESSLQVSATMTGIVDRLVDRGWVMRVRDPNDRRTLRVSLTAAGAELLGRVRARKHAWLREFLGTFTPDHRRQIIELAERYLQAMETAVEKDPNKS